MNERSTLCSSSMLFEESANVTLPGEIASGKLHGMIFGFHISPHTDSRHANGDLISGSMGI